MAKKEPVFNPPAGGDQTQASTNDQNQNTVLQDKPYLVVTYANRQAGVVSRFASEGEAQKDADARKASLEGTGTKLKVLKESDLPDFVAKVESGQES